MLKKVIIRVCILAIIFLSLILVGYVVLSQLFKPQYVEVIRITSLDRKVDAVVIERDGGAMSSVSHLVYIVPVNQRATKNDTIVFEAKRMFARQVSWKPKRLLQIKYTKADIYHFQSFVYPFHDNYDYKVQIREKQE